MIRPTAAALALGLFASAALAQPGPAPGQPVNPTARAQSSRNAGDEPLSNTGPVVERRSAERTERAGERKISDFDIATAPVVEQAKSSHHVLNLNGRPIGYTATAGTLTLRDDDGKPIASMFYVAYLADRVGGADRPVTFLYNGGPGSASLFLHMGSWGPLHVNTDSPNATHGAPYNLTDNP